MANGSILQVAASYDPDAVHAVTSPILPRIIKPKIAIAMGVGFASWPKPPSWAASCQGGGCPYVPPPFRRDIYTTGSVQGFILTLAALIGFSNVGMWHLS